MASGSGDAPDAGRLLASNTGWRFVAFAARTVGGLVATILVARTLGPREFGRFGFALALTLLLSFLVMLGLPKLLVRELARRPHDAARLLDSALLVAFAAGAVVSVLLLAVGGALGADTALLGMVGLALLADAGARIVTSLFWASERMRYEAASVGAQEAGFVVLTLLALGTDAGVEGVMLAYVTSRAIGFVVAWWFAARRFRLRVLPRPHPGGVRPIVRATMPFAIDDALSLAYVRIDAVLLGIFHGPTAVGLYGSATNLVLNLNVLPRMLNMSVYPRMSRAWPERPEELRRLRDAALRILGAIAMPIAVGAFVLAPGIVELVYGPGFEPAAGFLRLLAVIVPFRMLGNTLGTALTSADRQTSRAVVVGVAAGVNLVLNLALIPVWSIHGAIASTIVTEVGLFVAYAVLLRREAGRSSLVSSVVVPGIACVPLAIVAIAIPSGSLLVAIGAAGATYVVALAALVLATMPRPTVRPRALVGSFLATDRLRTG
jgi:O-antigen/teichoic acid export membrane protein